MNKCEKNIAIFGPFCDQGLGIQMREYYHFLNKNNYKVFIFSHEPFFAKKSDNSEWLGYNVFYSKFKRDNPNKEEIIDFVFKNKIKILIIPEICYSYIFFTIKYFKMCGVKIIAPMNIETLRYNEGCFFSDIDVIAANNYSSYLILKSIFGEKVKLLEFNNFYMKKSNFVNSNDFYHFGCFGGLNSIVRKNINNIYDLFFKIKNKKFKLNIYIQGNFNENDKLNLLPTENINILFKNKSYKEIIQEIRSNDIIVHLGDHEGLGLGFFEALNNNKPLVTLNTFPNKEYVLHGINGFLVDCSWIDLEDNHLGISRKAVVDMEDFEKTITYILENKKEVDKIINSENFINNNYESNFLNIIEELFF